MRTIALEEHFATAGFLRGPGSWLASRAGVIDAIAELGDSRIAAMDEGKSISRCCRWQHPVSSSWTA